MFPKLAPFTRWCLNTICKLLATITSVPKSSPGIFYLWKYQKSELCTQWNWSITMVKHNKKDTTTRLHWHQLQYHMKCTLHGAIFHTHTSPILGQYTFKSIVSEGSEAHTTLVSINIFCIGPMLLTLKVDCQVTLTVFLPSSLAQQLKLKLPSSLLQ